MRRLGGAGSRGWWSGAGRRAQVEDHAQALLEQPYRDRGWEVVDTRRGNPFDAIATTGESTLYLEAKGTQSSGGAVLVTAGEVAWVRTHQCVIGIVSGVRFQPDGQLDTTSGTLRIYPWSPREGGPDTHPVPVDPRTEKDQPEMLWNAVIATNASNHHIGSNRNCDRGPGCHKGGVPLDGRDAATGAVFGKMRV